MKKGKVLLLEDNPFAMMLNSYIKDELGYEVMLTNSIYDAHYYLTVNPKIDEFEALIFDANIGIPLISNNMPSDLVELIEKIPQKYKKIFGWYFVKEFLMTSYERYKDRIILYTGFLNNIYELEDENYVNSFKIVNKSDPEMMDKIDEYLKR